MTEASKKRIVLILKPLPKLFRDLEKIQSASPEKVKLIANPNGTIVATTLNIKPEKRSNEDERK